MQSRWIQLLPGEKKKKKKNATNTISMYLYTVPWPFPPVWGLADNKNKTEKTIRITFWNYDKDKHYILTQ